MEKKMRKRHIYSAKSDLPKRFSNPVLTESWGRALGIIFGVPSVVQVFCEHLWLSVIRWYARLKPAPWIMKRYRLHFAMPNLPAKQMFSMIFQHFRKLPSHWSASKNQFVFSTWNLTMALPCPDSLQHSGTGFARRKGTQLFHDTCVVRQWPVALQGWVWLVKIWYFGLVTLRYAC